MDFGKKGKESQAAESVYRICAGYDVVDFRAFAGEKNERTEGWIDSRSLRGGWKGDGRSINVGSGGPRPAREEKKR